MTDLMSRPYAPSTEKCCERCVFGSGPHAAWCQSDNARIERGTDCFDRTAEELARDFNGIFTGTRTAPRRRA